MTDSSNTKSATKIVQVGIGADPAHGSIPPPLYLSSTYLWPSLSKKGNYDYGRSNNPNRSCLAEALTEMDGGAGAVVTTSGMAAIDLVLNLLNADDLVIASHDCYGGTHRLLTHRAKQGRIRVEFVDQTHPPALEAALKNKPAMVMIETPSNPLMRVVDVAAICDLTKSAGAISVVDNTFRCAFARSRSAPISRSNQQLNILTAIVILLAAARSPNLRIISKNWRGGQMPQVSRPALLIAIKLCAAFGP
jgi:cystathionine gamma-synthase